jgi:hypothetical protein
MIELVYILRAMAEACGGEEAAPQLWPLGARLQKTGQQDM